MLTMRPDLRARMCEATARQHRNTPMAFTSSTRRQSATVNFSKGLSARVAETAALLTRMSTRPKRPIVRSTIPATLSSEETSASIGMMGRLEPESPSAASFAPLMSAMTTDAPSSARRRTMARPMPVAPPVTIATRSFSLNGDPPALCRCIDLAEALDAGLLDVPPRCRPVELQLDEAFEPAPLQHCQNGMEVHLASSRLQAPRRIGELDGGHSVPGGLQVGDQTAVHRLDVRGVENQFHCRAADGGDDLARIVDVMQQHSGQP